MGAACPLMKILPFRTGILLATMRLYPSQPERNRNVSQPFQYQLLRHEALSIYGRNILPIQGGGSVQEFRFALSGRIRQQVFYDNLVQNIETHIKSNAIAKALKQLCLKHVA